MDPGNWGTDIAAGSKFGYRLMWVLLLSNFMAVLLQTLATRLGVVTGRDLAQACRDSYPRPAAFGLWILCEIAIAACDLAELIGTIIALKLLFNLPYQWGLLIGAADTFILLALQRRGVRLLELVTLFLIAVIACSFCIEIFLARPDWAAVVRGFVPGLETSDPTRFTDSLYVAIGILGATVMPHNLYLHSALVQTRSFPQTIEGKRLACRYNFFDSLIALNGAFFVNAAILILAVSAFFPHEVTTLQDAHVLLGKVWTGLAAGLFAVALLASGQSSTLTGTLAGQVVMEGFLNFRLRPWARRLLTRLFALVPAFLAITFFGSENVWDPERIDKNLLALLILSQVVLSLQLPFAVIPLIELTSDHRRMGVFASRNWLKALAWVSAAIVIALNMILVVMQIQEWASGLQDKGASAWWIYATAGPVTLALGGFLMWLVLYPRWARPEEPIPGPAEPALPGIQYRRIGVAVEFENADQPVLRQAAALARLHGASLVVIHVVEGPGAAYYGAEADDRESRSDREQMRRLVDYLRAENLPADGVLGFGDPVEELVRIARSRQLDLLVLGTHGHRFFADLAFGQTVSPVLHRLRIPVLVVPLTNPPADAEIADQT
jgi:manganese transport protein